MSNIAAITERKVGERKVIVREITVADARAMFAETGSDDLFGDMLFADMRLSDICRMTDLTSEALDGMRPSEVAQVVAFCKEQNPDFFGMLARLYKSHVPA